MKLYECNYKVMEDDSEHYHSILTYQTNAHDAMKALHRYIVIGMGEDDRPHGKDGGYWFDAFPYGFFVVPGLILETTKEEWMENEFIQHLYK